MFLLVLKSKLKKLVKIQKIINKKLINFISMESTTISSNLVIGKSESNETFMLTLKNSNLIYFNHQRASNNNQIYFYGDYVIEIGCTLNVKTLAEYLVETKGVQGNPDLK